MIRYIGIDLHKHLIVGHVVDAAGKKVDTFRYESVDATTLAYVGRNRLRPEDHVVMEATTHCWAVVRVLEPFVARVAVSNPMATKAIAKAKVKTDKVDAAVLSISSGSVIFPRSGSQNAPRATEGKLAKLRTAATGQKRRGGLGQGVDLRKARPSGQKGQTRRSLPDVYISEQIPAAAPAPAGERRHVAELKLEAFVEDLQQTHVVPRRSRKKVSAPSD